MRNAAAGHDKGVRQTKKTQEMEEREEKRHSDDDDRRRSCTSALCERERDRERRRRLEKAGVSLILTQCRRKRGFSGHDILARN
jgi:hypothetical protein